MWSTHLTVKWFEWNCQAAVYTMTLKTEIRTKSTVNWDKVYLTHSRRCRMSSNAWCHVKTAGPRILLIVICLILQVLYKRFIYFVVDKTWLYKTVLLRLRVCNISAQVGTWRQMTSSWRRIDIRSTSFQRRVSAWCTAGLSIIHVQKRETFTFRDKVGGSGMMLVKQTHDVASSRLSITLMCNRDQQDKSGRRFQLSIRGVRI